MGAVESSIRRVGSRVEADLDVRLSRSRFEPGALPELRKFWTATSALDGTVVASGP